MHTPQHVGWKVDKAINDLNAQWDLGLPRLHGREADTAEAKGPLATKCSSIIRFLCFRTDKIDHILAGFEEHARKKYSRWRWKPSQERGTLPTLPVTKSLLASDVQTKREAGLIRLSDPQRQELLQLLYDVLDEPFQLAKMSESFSYERPPSFLTAPSTPRKESSTREVATPSRQILQSMDSLTSHADEPQVKDPTRKSSKRSLGSPEGKNKRQMTLSEFPFQRNRDASPLWLRPLLQPDPISFETVPSARVSSVFTTTDEGHDPCTSNETSMMSSVSDCSQNLFPTQDYHDLMDDEEFNTSFNEACEVPKPVDPLDLAQYTPFKRSALLPSDVPFWYCWEIHRVASVVGLVPIDVYKAVRKSVRQTNPPYEEVWKALRQLCHEKAGKTVPKSELANWTTAENQYENPQHQLQKGVYLTGNLDWNDDGSQGLFSFRLNEIHQEQSCRLHRKFGADRFLVISAPDFSRFPKQIRQADEEMVHEGLTEFLATGSHFIAGRYWRVFWIEPEKNKKKKKGREQLPRLKIHLFAEQGYDIVSRNSEHLNIANLKDDGRHRELTIEDLTEWHMPIRANIRSTNLKLFSRWAIVLSKTVPTTVLKQKEFLYLHDPPGAVVMNDGCARMSYALAKDIWAKYGGAGDVPSAVQGRIGGAKGLWLVDYSDAFRGVSDRQYWIQVSDSQLKVKPHPRDRSDADESQRTFEVLKFAGDSKPAHLNMQLITILEDRGVSRHTLQAQLEADTRSYFESLKAAMADPKALRLWMQEYGLASRPEVRKVVGSFPIDHREQMKRLLEAGFHPQECVRLKELAAGFLRDYMTNYVEKLWINVPCSTVVFCAPDPLGVLEEDEVCLNFSSPVTDPRRDYPETTLDGLEVLVARNPAYLASDMQLRKAVYHHELRHYKNIILFPVKGKQPLASLLSGGDYDGDTVTVIWDPAIVKDFQNTMPPDLPKEEQCGMVQESQPLSSIFDGIRRPEEAMRESLRGCISFNARPSLMGVCSSEHEKLIYSLSLKRVGGKLSNPGALKLAALAGYLVDSNKQGWSLKRQAFYLLRRDASGLHRLPDPAFKGDKAPSRASGTYLNIIDFLKFEVAEGCKTLALREFKELCPATRPYDGVLSETWRKAETKADQEKTPPAVLPVKSGRISRNMLTGPQAPVGGLKEILLGPDGLLKQIDELRKMAAKLAAIRKSISSTPANPSDRKKFHVEVQALFERYQQIEPKQVDHELRRRFENERDHPFPYWSLLRASCLHRRACGNGGFPVWVWYVAGRELCILKTLHHPGEVRLVTAEMHNILKVDSKFTKGLLEGSVSETGEVFYDAVDEPNVGDDDDDDDDDDVDDYAFEA